MAKVILKVLVLIVVIGYAALFISWNPTPTIVVGAIWPPTDGQQWVQEMPVGYLPLVGALLGAVFMAIAAWGEWARQKGATDKASAQVQQAKTKLQELADRINQQRDQITQLEKKLAQVQPGGQQPARGKAETPATTE